MSLSEQYTPESVSLLECHTMLRATGHTQCWVTYQFGCSK